MALIPPNTWHSPCGVPYRWLADGRFEVEGAGFPSWDLGSAHANQLRTMWSKWGAAITRAAKTNGIPTSWLVGLMKIETGGNPTLCSSAGACGLMQFMPFTCKTYGHACSYYNEHPEDQITDAGNLLVKIASSKGGCVLSGVKGYNGGGPCSAASGINVNTPGIVGMWGENNYVEGFIRAANTFVALDLPSMDSSFGGGSTVPAATAGIVICGVLGAVAYMFADLQWDLTERIARAVGIDRWNA